MYRLHISKHLQTQHGGILSTFSSSFILFVSLDPISTNEASHVTVKQVVKAAVNYYFF